MQNSAFIQKYRAKVLMVFATAWMIWLYRLASHSLFSQMEQPPFLFQEGELLYRWLLSSGAPQFITSMPVASLLFDALLFILPATFLFSMNRIFVVLYTIAVLFYFMTFNMVTGHHYHSLAGLIVMTLPFWFQKPEKFEMAWSLARYYLLYIFASAALWKITRGSAFDSEHLSNILKGQQLDLILQQPSSLRAQFAQYLIAHPPVSHVLLLANTLLQLSFLTGFFTRRFDTILFWLAIIFYTANYFVMNIVSFELLILNITLIKRQPVEQFILKYLPRGTATAN